MPTISTRDGVNLHVKTWGEGRPVVLLHGWPLSSDTWDPQAVALANLGYKVVAYDRRGFGRSDQPWKGYDYDSLTDDLADVMRACGATEDVTLVGFSMGGGEVARYMSRHGGKGVVGAALVASVVPRMLLSEDNPDGVDASTFDQMTSGILSDRAAFMRQFLADFFGQGLLVSNVSEETMDWAWNIAMQAGLNPTLECAKSFATTDFTADLAHFKVPTLIIHGTQDRTVPIDATGRAAAKAIPQSQFLEYDSAPHGLFATHSDELTNDLVALLSGSSTRKDLPHLA